MPTTDSLERVYADAEERISQALAAIRKRRDRLRRAKPRRLAAKSWADADDLLRLAHDLEATARVAECADLVEQR